MAMGGFPPEGGGFRAPTYAERLKTNVKYDQRLKRNVLEIVLEKTDREADHFIPQENISNVFKTIGIDVAKQVEGYQVKYDGKNSIISVWMFAGIGLEKFCVETIISR